MLAFLPVQYVWVFFFFLLQFSSEWDYWARPLCQLCFQLPLGSYQGTECEMISHCGDCPLALSHAPLQHLISTLLMPCATPGILYRQREIDRGKLESLEAAARTHLPIQRTHCHTGNKAIFHSSKMKHPRSTNKWKKVFYQNSISEDIPWSPVLFLSSAN